MIITIDGRCGMGKSTIGSLLAQRLGFVFLSSGLFIRAMAWEYRRRLDAGAPDDQALAEAIESLSLDEMESIPLEQLRDDALSPYMKTVNLDPRALEAANRLMRAFCAGRDVVVDGRDTFDIIPEADLTYYFESTQEKRARLMEKTQGRPFDECLAHIKRRDAAERDVHVPYDRLIVIDPLDAPIEDTVARMVEDVKRRGDRS